MILLVIDDRRENISVYLETLTGIGGAINRGRSKRKLRQDKVGKDVLIAFDETKRMLCLCTPTKVWAPNIAFYLLQTLIQLTVSITYICF